MTYDLDIPLRLPLNSNNNRFKRRTHSLISGIAVRQQGAFVNKHQPTIAASFMVQEGVPLPMLRDTRECFGPINRCRSQY